MPIQTRPFVWILVRRDIFELEANLSLILQQFVEPSCSKSTVLIVNRKLNYQMAFLDYLIAYFLEDIGWDESFENTQ